MNGPTYVRGLGAFMGWDATEYFSSGNHVFYKTYSFVATTSGSQTFTVQKYESNDAYYARWQSTYLALYQSTFNPNSPATNFLLGNEGLPSLTYTLVAGTTYFVVLSPDFELDTGTFTLTSTTAVFPGPITTNQWFTNANGGSPIFTGEVFNPVGYIPNTEKGIIGIGSTYVRGEGNNTSIYTSSEIPVFYKTCSFVASNSGNQTFTITEALTRSGFEYTHMALYQIDFNPDSPATNFLLGGEGLPSLFHTLVADTLLFLVHILKVIQILSL